MKHLAAILLTICVILHLSCSKETTKDAPVRSRSGEITFAAGDVVPVTKASVVTATTLGMTGFNVSAAKGTPGSETEVWTNVAFSKNGNVFSGGMFWPFSDESYCFYAANAPLAFQAAGGKIAAANATTAADKDIVAAYLPYGTTSTTTAVYMEENTLTFRHIFARIGSVTVSAKSGYTVDNISISITPKISGDYNIRTGEGHTDATGWSSTSNGSPVGIANATPGTKANNLYLVPGTYTLTLGWRATKGDYVKTYSGVTKDVDIAKGNVNTISCTLGGEAQEIVISVALNPWTSATANAELEEWFPSFSIAADRKVLFAPGNLQAVISGGPVNSYGYTASSWRFAEHQYDSIGDNAGNNSFAIGTVVDLFGWVGASASYDTYGLCTNTSYRNVWYGTGDNENIKTDWGSIPGISAMIGSGWWTMNPVQWNYLFNVRPNAASLYGHCQISTSSGTVCGMLILPDEWAKPANCTVTPGTGSYDRVTYSATASSGVTNAWCDMESAGAVFLPVTGYRNGLTINETDTQGYYWCYTSVGNMQGKSVRIYNNNFKIDMNVWRYFGGAVRLVKDAD